jgi:multidrug efflux system membrane fusion protein
MAHFKNTLSFFKCSFTIGTVILWCLGLTASCSSEKMNNASRPRAHPVTVAVAERKTVPVQIQAVGSVEAYSTVSVKARVGGELQEVKFTEGDRVKKGELLFIIDPRPYEAAVRQAEATLARDSYQEKNAAAQAQRYASLLKEGVTNREQYDQMQSTADALAASVRADQAALDHARLELEYCFIRSPIDGSTGNLIVHQGNIIKANDTDSLVVIHQIIPVYVSFSVPEKELPAIKTHMTTGKLPVEVRIPEGDAAPVSGDLSFINNAVDIDTGTIMLKALFPNTDTRLWPGQFVNVTLTVAQQPDAVTVPSQAVLTGQSGPYVFVITPDHTAELRMVTSGIAHAGGVVIDKGLQSGETVVTDGQLQLSPGAAVEIKNTPVPEDGGR